jgi:hypothetical protein
MWMDRRVCGGKMQEMADSADGSIMADAGKGLEG